MVMKSKARRRRITVSRLRRKMKAKLSARGPRRKKIWSKMK